MINCSYIFCIFFWDCSSNREILGKSSGTHLRYTTPIYNKTLCMLSDGLLATTWLVGQAYPNTNAIFTTSVSTPPVHPHPTWVAKLQLPVLHWYCSLALPLASLATSPHPSRPLWLRCPHHDHIPITCSHSTHTALHHQLCCTNQMPTRYGHDIYSGPHLPASFVMVASF